MFANRVLATYLNSLGLLSTSQPLWRHKALSHYLSKYKYILFTMYWERSRVYFSIVTATGITETGGQTLKISCHTALEIKATDA